jgi:hypothetical protein
MDILAGRNKESVMQTIQLVKTAMKEKAPALHAQLTAAGTLNEYAQELADQISDQSVTMTQADRVREKWDDLGPMECAAMMRTARALNREKAIEQALEFPQDETSPPSPGATTPSDPMT